MTSKSTTKTAAYTVLRDCAVGQAGDTINLEPDDAALLIRDGMVAPKED